MTFSRRRVVQIAVVILIAAWYLLFGCPIRFLTGIACPSCGMSRAALCVITGKFSQAVYYNMCIYALPLPCIAFLFRKKLGMKAFYAVSLVFLTFLTAYYICRMINGSDIAVFNPPDGLIYRIINFLRS